MRYDNHNHTRYSNIRLRDALPTPEALIDKAIELGLAGISISEHECVSSHVKANKYYQEKNNEVLYSEVMYIDLPALVEDEENAILKNVPRTTGKQRIQKVFALFRKSLFQAVIIMFPMCPPNLVILFL